MKVETKLKTIQDEAGTQKQELSVCNHTVHPERVVLKIADKFEIHVNANELTKAIENVQNH